MPNLIRNVIADRMRAKAMEATVPSLKTIKELRMNGEFSVHDLSELSHRVSQIFSLYSVALRAARMSDPSEQIDKMIPILEEDRNRAGEIARSLNDFDMRKHPTLPSGAFRKFREEDRALADDCWKGYERVPGKKKYEKGSCRKIKDKNEVSDELWGDSEEQIGNQLSYFFEDEFPFIERKINRIKKMKVDFPDYENTRGIESAAKRIDLLLEIVAEMKKMVQSMNNPELDRLIRKANSSLLAYEGDLYHIQNNELSAADDMPLDDEGEKALEHAWEILERAEIEMTESDSPNETKVVNDLHFAEGIVDSAIQDLRDSHNEELKKKLLDLSTRIGSFLNELSDDENHADDMMSEAQFAPPKEDESFLLKKTVKKRLSYLSEITDFMDPIFLKKLYNAISPFSR